MSVPLDHPKQILAKHSKCTIISNGIAYVYTIRCGRIFRFMGVCIGCQHTSELIIITRSIWNLYATKLPKTEATFVSYWILHVDRMHYVWNVLLSAITNFTNISFAQLTNWMIELLSNVRLEIIQTTRLIIHIKYCTQDASVFVRIVGHLPRIETSWHIDNIV